MKKRLLELLEKRKAKKTELLEKVDETEDLEEIKGFRTDLEALEAEIRDLEAMIGDIPDDEEGEGRSAKVGGARIIATYGMEGGKPAEDPDKRSEEDPYGTIEYRKAFKDYVLTGKKSEILLRTDAVTATTDVGAVIPTNIMNKVVEEMAEFGLLWSKVAKSNLPGGVKIPYASVKPTATWTTEGSVADTQKKSIAGSITFGYYKLQIRVAETLMTNVVTLAVFEQTITSNINEAMVTGIETAIIDGSGDGQPLGIMNDTNIPDGHKTTVTAAKMSQYNTWTTIMGKIPKKYRSGAMLLMNDSDWNKYIVGMVDANGQPVARTTYGINGTETERFLGKQVLTFEDAITSIDAAESGDTIGILIRPKDYLWNSNMSIAFKRYFDENTDEWISKSTLIADGKLADFNGVILINKA